MAPMLVAVERQHAGSDHPSRREAGIVDRETLSVAHDVDAQIAAGDHPAVEDRDPRNWLMLAQARQRVIGLDLEVMQRQRGSQRR